MTDERPPEETEKKIRSLRTGLSSTKRVEGTGVTGGSGWGRAPICLSYRAIPVSGETCVTQACHGSPVSERNEEGHRGESLSLRAPLGGVGRVSPCRRGSWDTVVVGVETSVPDTKKGRTDSRSFLFFRPFPRTARHRSARPDPCGDRSSEEVRPVTPGLWGE